jgi:transcriptional regulator with XRE-family HTH domain
MDIGKRLQELRHARGLSQGDMQKRTGLLRCYVSRVECGHTEPKLGTLEKWAKALDVELYQLFYEGEGEPAAPTVSRSSRRHTRQGALLHLFKRMPEGDKGLFLALARTAVGMRGKHE